MRSGQLYGSACAIGVLQGGPTASQAQQTALSVCIQASHQSSSIKAVTPGHCKLMREMPDDAISLCRLAPHMCPPEGEGSLKQRAVRFESPEQVAVFVHAHHSLPSPVQPAPQSNLNLHTQCSEALSLAAEPAVRPATTCSHMLWCSQASGPLMQHREDADHAICRYESAKYSAGWNC